jgi:hypothetical protein
MGIFNRKNNIIDLTEDYRPQRKARIKEDSEVSPSDNSSEKSQESSTGSFFNFFGSSNNSNTSNTSSSSASSSSSEAQSYSGNFDPETGKPLDAGEKRRRLAKRLKSMTDRIEEQANQIYRLQQRIELLEKRTQKNDSN